MVLGGGRREFLPRYAMLCYAMVGLGMVCYGRFWYGMVWYTMLCYAMVPVVPQGDGGCGDLGRGAPWLQVGGGIKAIYEGIHALGRFGYER